MNLSASESMLYIFFKEFVNGMLTEESRPYLSTIIGQMKGRGCNGVVMGCTEMPLGVDRSDCLLPNLDSTRVLARAALRKSIKEGQQAGAGDA
jgi:aspartate racemase